MEEWIMNSSQFDTITRLFAERRTSRRTALAASAGVLAAGLAPVAARDASPVADGTPAPSDTARVPFMFVQSLGAGSLAPKAGEEGTLILSADHLAGQTIFFSDRPERIVGMVPTERFFGAQGAGGLGFTPVDPPNAALVLAATGDHPTDVVILELIDPTFDVASGTVTYEVRVLDDIEDMDLQLQQAPLTATEAARDFTAASLFIDDCANGSIVCWNGSNQVGVSDPMGFCYNSSDVCCAPCQAPDGGSWTAQCNEWFQASCEGNCTASYSEAWYQCPAS
jgi:hypothetical protein